MKSILHTIVVLGYALSSLAAVAQTPVLLRTFNNPTPAAGDNFGTSLAALGNDRVLVGAPYDDSGATNAGAVYLFHTNGTLLTTFTNPNPASLYSDGDQFGCAIATLGSDRVLIGSPNEGKVYLYTTNGALVQTISGSSTGDAFGYAIAAFGNDLVLIGVHYANLGLGAAYLYSTNGALLTTFNSPDGFWFFGLSVAAFGSDRVLIGAEERAYLFGTNGTLLTTFTNPAPYDSFDCRFGYAVAAAGTDRILVSDYGIDKPVGDAGSVYVFNTNGTLLTTITNPTPQIYDSFGATMAMLGNDRVVIGALYDNTTGPGSGSAYVFDLNGTLLATLNNPTPATEDHFGFQLAAFGSEGVIIGAPYDDAGATNAGSVYLFSVPATPAAPSLTIRRTTTNTVVVSWPAPSTGFVLQQHTNGVSSVNWSNVTSGIQTEGANMFISVSPLPGNRLFRLFKP